MRVKPLWFNLSNKGLAPFRRQIRESNSSSISVKLRSKALLQYVRLYQFKVFLFCSSKPSMIFFAANMSISFFFC